MPSQQSWAEVKDHRGERDLSAVHGIFSLGLTIFSQNISPGVLWMWLNRADVKWFLLQLTCWWNIFGVDLLKIHLRSFCYTLNYYKVSKELKLKQRSIQRRRGQTVDTWLLQVAVHEEVDFIAGEAHDGWFRRLHFGAVAGNGKFDVF